VDSQLIQRLTGGELSIRGLGIAGAEGGRTGIAVQDWKITKQGLFASGLSKSTRANQNLASSRLVILEDALAPDFKRREIILPRYNGVELGREAMSVSDDNIYVLPEDLGATNRLFRISKADLLKSD